MVKTEIDCDNCSESIILVTREETMVNFCPNCGTSQDLSDSIYSSDDE